MKFDKTDEYYNSLDKRSREYKAWKRAKKDKEIEGKEISVVGAGDVVEAITEATGIKKVVKSIFGDDCGCDERKEKLNKSSLVSIKVINCPTEQERVQMDKFFSGETAVGLMQMFAIYNRVFGTKESPSCPMCRKKVRTGLFNLVKAYND